MELQFYYDIVCPYAYLASLRVQALAERTGATLRWCPVLLGGLYKHHGSAAVPATTWASARVEVGRLDLLREAERNGAPFQINPLHPRRSVEAMRLIVAADPEVRPQLSAALFRAYHVEGADISDPHTLRRIAKPFGIALSIVEEANVKQELHYLTAEAADRGCFGVPSFIVKDTLWWGQDRMHMVEAALGGTGHLEPPESGGENHAPVRLFHDFSSPFSYLASTQIERIAARHGRTVAYKPFLLGALFRAIGTADVPLFAMGQAKMRYMQKDVRDWARWWGVDFTFADPFPLRTVLPLRISIIEPKAIAPLYRAAWVSQLDIGDPGVVAAVLDDAELDGAGLVDHARDPQIKAELIANGEEALELGICGAPTAVVNGELFWGQDRLNRMAEALAG